MARRDEGEYPSWIFGGRATKSGVLARRKTDRAIFKTRSKAFSPSRKMRPQLIAWVFTDYSRRRFAT
jgi:hypothetical protein